MSELIESEEERLLKVCQVGWPVEGTPCGFGSTLAGSADLRKTLPKLLSKWNVKHMLDCGCGDHNWIKYVNLKGVKYVGCDWIKRTTWNDSEFLIKNILSDDLPDTDLIMVRDVTIHFTNEMFYKFIDNILRGKFKYLLTVTDMAENNTSRSNSVRDTGWAPINMQAAPFLYPEPIDKIPDTGGFPEYAQRYMALWSREQVEENIKQRNKCMSDFNPVMCIMQPREIPECINAIRDNAKMPDTYEKIPLTWFRGFTEAQVCVAINQYVGDTNFSHYIINADDNILYRHAMLKLINLTKGLSKKEAKKNIITGWCNMHLEEDGSLSDISNVCSGEITLVNDHIPLVEDYPGIMTVDEINKQDKPVRTGYLNFGISCIPRELLLKYPMDLYEDRASDHHISYRMQKDGIKFWIHRDTFVKHLRQGWSPLKRNWLVGTIQPEIIEEGHN